MSVLRVPLRDRLRASAAVLGFDVRVTDDASWGITDGVLTVGLGWYADRGIPDGEGIALALLELWQGPRAQRVSRDRELRAASLRRRRPDLVPLIGATLRLLAASELIAALPGLRVPLAAGLRRTEFVGVTDLPRHLQWVCLVLAAGTHAVEGSSAEARVLAGLAPEVLAEWQRLAELVPGAAHPLALALGGDTARGRLGRFERALGLLLAGHDRLLARDLADRGITDAGSETGDGAGDDAEALLTDSAGMAESGGADDEDASASAGSDSAEGESESDPDDAERARKGEGRQAAEGADLFAAEQAGFVETVLETPMPAGSSSLDTALELPPEARADAKRTMSDPALGIGSGSGSSPLNAYRNRVADLADPIERMRRVFERVIAERLGERGTMSRTAHSEGDELAGYALASAIAEARAGVAAPRAFSRREHRARRTRRAGSTDYVLLVDRSASMQGPPAEAAADAMLIMSEALAAAGRDVEHASVVRDLDLGLDLRTALIVFDAEPLVVKPLSKGMDDSHRRALHGATRSPRGATNDAAALRAAAIEFGIAPRIGGSSRAADGGANGTAAVAADPVERKRVLFIVGDGGSNDPGAAHRELRALRAAGVAVHAIGIGSDELTDRFAPGGVRLDDPRALPDAILRLIERELT